MGSINNFLTRRLFNNDASYMLPVSSFDKRIDSQALIYKDQPMSQAQLERLVVGATPLDVRAQMMTVLSDPKNPIYYDGFIFRGVNGLTIAQAFDRICKIATEVILIKAPRMPYKTAQFMAQKLVRLFPDFAMKDLPNNINYGSKEWAKMHIGFSYAKKQGQSVDDLSTAQLLTLGDSALKANTNWGEKLLLFMVAANGQLDLGRLDATPSPELKKILTRIASEAFADDLTKAALLNKLIEDHKILSAIQKNPPTLPSPHTTEQYAAYDRAFSTYRDRFAGMVKMVFEDQTALLPVWAQTEIRVGRARPVTLKLGISYKKDGVTTISQKYHYDQPGVFPFFLQIMHEGKERFVLYMLGAVAPELLPEGREPAEFMTERDMNAFFPKEWVKQKLQEALVNQTALINAFNRREVPEGQVDIIPFIERHAAGHTRSFQEIGVNLFSQFRNIIQATHQKTTYQNVIDQIAKVLQPVVALVPGAGELTAFAQGDVKGAIISLLADLVMIFGVGTVSKALESGALASLMGKSANFVEKLVDDTIEKIRPSKLDPASLELIPLIDMGTERTSIESLLERGGKSAQIGQAPIPPSSSSDPIPFIDMGTEETSLESLWGSEGGITGTFTDANNQTSTAIFRLKPGQKTSDPTAIYGILDDNTKKISPQNYLKNPGSNHFVQTGLKGGAPGAQFVLTTDEILDGYTQLTRPFQINLERIGPDSASLFQDKTNARFYYYDIERGAYCEIFQNNGSQIFRPADSKNWYIPHPDGAAPHIWLELKDGGFVRTSPQGAMLGASPIGDVRISGSPPPERTLRLTPEEIATYKTDFPKGVLPTAFHPPIFNENVTFGKIEDGRNFYVDDDGYVFEMIVTHRSAWIIKAGAAPLEVIADANGYPSVSRSTLPPSLPVPDQAGGSAANTGIDAGQEVLNTPEAQSFLNRKSKPTIRYINDALARGRLSNINFAENHKGTTSMRGLVTYKGKIYGFTFGSSSDSLIYITNPATGKPMIFPGATERKPSEVNVHAFWKMVANNTDPVTSWPVSQTFQAPDINIEQEVLNTPEAQLFLGGKSRVTVKYLKDALARGRLFNTSFVENRRDSVSMQGMVVHEGKIYGFTFGAQAPSVSVFDPATGKPTAFPLGTPRKKNEVSSNLFWKAIASDTGPLPASWPVSQSAPV